MDTNEFGQAVKARRKEEKMSQQVLAEKVGISRNYLSQIERGQSTNLSWQLRQRLTEILGLQEDDAARTTDITDGIPSSLKEFAQTANLPPDDVAMLAKLQYRGQQPTTPEKWELLYNVIKVTIGS